MRQTRHCPRRDRAPASDRTPPLPAALDRRGQDAYFVVCDHNGQALAYVYAEDKRTGAKPLTRDEARCMAANIARLPKLLRAEPPDANALMQRRP